MCVGNVHSLPVLEFHFVGAFKHIYDLARLVTNQGIAVFQNPHSEVRSEDSENSQLRPRPQRACRIHKTSLTLLRSLMVSFVSRPFVAMKA